MLIEVCAELKIEVVGQPQAIVELVVSGLGISVFPFWAIKSVVEAGKLVPKPISKKGVVLIWSALFLKGNNTPIYQQEFIRMMQRMDIVNLNELK